MAETEHSLVWAWKGLDNLVWSRACGASSVLTPLANRVEHHGQVLETIQESAPTYRAELRSSVVAAPSTGGNTLSG